jgi:hypothetical protein
MFASKWFQGELPLALHPGTQPQQLQWLCGSNPHPTVYESPRQTRGGSQRQQNLHVEYLLVAVAHQGELVEQE